MTTTINEDQVLLVVKDDNALATWLEDPAVAATIFASLRTELPNLTGISVSVANIYDLDIEVISLE